MGKARRWINRALIISEHMLACCDRLQAPCVSTNYLEQAAIRRVTRRRQCTIGSPGRHKAGGLSLRAERNAARTRPTLRSERCTVPRLSANAWGDALVWRSIFSPVLTGYWGGGSGVPSSIRAIAPESRNSSSTSSSLSAAIGRCGP